MVRKLTSVILAAAAALFLVSASAWEGTAVMSSYGEFPQGGFYGACNSFPRNTVIEVKNLENGKTIQVIITKGVDNPGVLLTVSPEAAQALGMVQGTISRIRVSYPKNPIEAPLRQEQTLESEDPDLNPRLLALSEIKQSKAGAEKESGLKPETTETLKTEKTADTKQDDNVLPQPVVEGKPADLASEIKDSGKGESEAVPEPFEMNVVKASKEGASEELGLPQAPEVDKGISEAAEVPAESGIKRSEEPVELSEDMSMPSLQPLARDEPEIVEEEFAIGETVPTEALSETAPTGEAPPVLEEKPEPAEKEEIAETEPAEEAPAPAESAFLASDLVLVVEPETDTSPRVLPMLEEVVETAESLPETVMEVSGSDAGPKAVETGAEASWILDSPAEPPKPEVTPEGEGSEVKTELALAPVVETPEPMPVKPEETKASSDENAEVFLVTAPLSPPPAEKPPETGASQVLSEPLIAIQPQPESVKTGEGTIENGGKLGQDAASALAKMKAVKFDSLEKGVYYIQIAAYRSLDSAANALEKISGSYPIGYELAKLNGQDLYRIFIGPLKRDESGVVLVRLKALGYKDAFVKKGG